MTAEQVIRHFGGVNATALALGIKQASVSRWRKNRRVPYLRQLHIAQVTGGKLRASNKANGKPA